MFEYHSLGFETINAIGLIWEALPPDVGAELLEHYNAGEIRAGMEPLELTPTYGFKWTCGYGILETGVWGLSIHIASEEKGATLTLKEVKKLEKSILKRSVLSHRSLVVIPHCTNRKITTDMIWNLNRGKHWSTDIR